MKKLWTVGLVVAMMMAIGCSGVQKIGMVGSVEIYEATTNSILAPSSTTILTKTEDGAVARINGGMGGSSVGQLAQPVATVGAAYLIKEGMGDIRPDTYTDNSKTATVSGAGAASGSVAAASSKSSSSSKATNANANFNSNKAGAAAIQSQGQGQLQGQGQGQIVDQSKKSMF